MKKSKRCVTLLELLIAIGLTAILLTALLGYYAQAMHAQTAIEKALQRNFQLLYTQFRLNKIMPTIMNPASDSSKMGIYFFTQPPENPEEKSESLIFTYDNGTGSGSLFSNEAIGKLFLDRKGRLVLLSWPPPKRYREADAPMRVEILQENVESLAFKFYKPLPPENKLLSIDPKREQGEYDTELSYWPATEEDLPAFMRIKVKIKEREEPVEYAFLLSNTNTPVHYP